MEDFRKESKNFLEKAMQLRNELRKIYFHQELAAYSSFVPLSNT